VRKCTKSKKDTNGALDATDTGVMRLLPYDMEEEAESPLSRATGAYAYPASLRHLLTLGSGMTPRGRAKI
jgi:hypothetical protein